MAKGAHGVVTRRQLLAAGLSIGEIRRRLESGALLAEHRGVYRVGHRAPDTQASYVAAVLACGDGTVLAGLCAARQYGAVKGAPPPEVIARSRHTVRGVICHRGSLDPRDTTMWLGLPTVTVARALVDVAGRLGMDELARACHEAGVRYRTSPRHVEDALSRRTNAPGAARLRAVMAGDVKVSLSKLESRFLGLLRECRLPLPDTNRPASGRHVDCRWPATGLTVELDSYTFHNSRHAWQRDRQREREAYARGDAFRRYSWSDVFEKPHAMLTELDGLLRTEAASPRGAYAPSR